MLSPKEKGMKGNHIFDVPAAFYSGSANERTGDSIEIYRLTKDAYVVVINNIIESTHPMPYDRAMRLYNMKVR